MSCLFQLGDDGFRSVLSWLDFASICYLDIAVGNKAERLLWLHSLHTIDSAAIDGYEHCHSSIRWLITRGARTTRIQVRRIVTTSQGEKNDTINDLTFASVDFICAWMANYLNKGCVLNTDETETETPKSSGKILESDLSSASSKCRGVTNSAECSVPIRIQGCLYMTSVTSIDLYNCNVSDIRMSTIAQSCPQLTSINLHCCKKITNVGVSSLVQGCSHLTSIDLRGCNNISNEGVIAITESCHHLTSIDLSYCHSVSDIGVISISESCHYLTSINLSADFNLSDIGVSALVEGCHNLTSINLTYCNKITDMSLLAIAEGCHNLTSIDLSYCWRISDIGVIAIAQVCSQLTSINLSYNQNISDNSISAIVQGCPHLTEINLSGCHRISDIGVTALAQGFSQSTSIYLIGNLGMQRIERPNFHFIL